MYERLNVRETLCSNFGSQIPLRRFERVLATVVGDALYSSIVVQWCSWIHCSRFVLLVID